jgi:hypothetical protein
MSRPREYSALERIPVVRQAVTKLSECDRDSSVSSRLTILVMTGSPATVPAQRAASGQHGCGSSNVCATPSAAHSADLTGTMNTVVARAKTRASRNWLPGAGMEFRLLGEMQLRAATHVLDVGTP